MEIVKTLLRATAIAALSITAFARDLAMNANISDPAQKQAMEVLIADFEAAYPDIDVKFNFYHHEAFKVALRNFFGFRRPDGLTS